MTIAVSSWVVTLSSTAEGAMLSTSMVAMPFAVKVPSVTV